MRLDSCTAIECVIDGLDMGLETIRHETDRQSKLASRIGSRNSSLVLIIELGFD
jgi:hypothetical protein